MSNAPKMMNLKGKEYLPAAERVVWFKNDYPETKSQILTKIVSFTEELAVVEAEIYLLNESATYIKVANDYKVEHRKDFPDYLEKASTGAIARALARCGYGTVDAQQEQAGRIADAPVEPRAAAPTLSVSTSGGTVAASAPAPDNSSSAPSARNRGFKRAGGFKPPVAAAANGASAQDVDVL